MKIQYTFVDIAGNRYDMREMFNRFTIQKRVYDLFSRVEGILSSGEHFNGYAAFFVVGFNDRLGTRHYEVQEIDTETAKAANLAAALQFMDDTTVKWSGKA